MKFEVLQENLGGALAQVLRVVSTRPQLPVLSNFLIEAKKEGVYIVGTDLEMGMRVRVDGKIEQEGRVTVPARMFGEFVGSIPAGKVEVSSEKETLKVKSGAYAAKFQTIAADEFPELPDTKKSKGVSFLAKEIEEAGSRVLFAAARDSMRPVLTGILFEFQSKKVKLVATDGFRLALQTVDFQGEGKPSNVIVPARVMAEVVRASGERVEMKTLDESNQVVFEMEDVVVVAQLLDGNFPDYRKIIPGEFKIEVEMGREELLQAVKVGQVFARDNSNVNAWKVEKGRLTMKTESPEMGTNMGEVEAKVQGGEGEIVFNGKFLLDFLGAIEGEAVWFGMNDALSPGGFRVEGDNNFLYIVMPINL